MCAGIRKSVLGHLKYPHLAKVVKTCLSCSQGNADSERSFSTNTHVVTAQRTCLAEDTVMAIRTVKDAVRFSGGSAADSCHRRHAAESTNGTQ